jgi:hypothetical protein
MQALVTSGLPEGLLFDIALAHLVAAGPVAPQQLAELVKLPPAVVEELVAALGHEGLLSVSTGGGVELTEAGRGRGVAWLDRAAYLGPVPVPWEQYAAAMADQSLRGGRGTRAEIEPFFSDLSLNDQVVVTVGAFLNHRHALLLHGPSGNGKTAVAERVGRCLGGPLLVPRAVWVDEVLLPIFDLQVHGAPSAATVADGRWVVAQRPVVTTGPEVRWSQPSDQGTTSSRREPPWPLKVNGGVWVVDHLSPGGQDEGMTRGLMDLLDHWLVGLTLPSGRRARLPVEVVLLCCTTMPLKAMDRSLLRRFPYTLYLGRPDRAAFGAIFAKECQRRGLTVDGPLTQHLLRQVFHNAKAAPSAGDVGRLLDRVADLCRFQGRPLELSPELLDQAAACTSWAVG